MKERLVDYDVRGRGGGDREGEGDVRKGEESG